MVQQDSRERAVPTTGGEMAGKRLLDSERIIIGVDEDNLRRRFLPNGTFA